jgi:hypothetical protein
LLAFSQNEEAAMTEVSLLRLYVMRAFFLLLFLERGYRVLPTLTAPPAPLGVWDGVAYSFWGALALLALVGIRYPLQMVPVLLMFLLYKLLWLVGVALPLWRTGAAFDPLTTQFTWAMAVGAAIDLLVIPWGFIMASYISRPGSRWTDRGAAPARGPSAAQKEEA